MHDTMPSAVSVRVDGQIAGFVVAERSRWRFIATDRRFAVLDGSRFWHFGDAQRAADRLERTVARDGHGGSRQSPAPPASPDQGSA